ncbi:hypothetical protein FN846DRAFT_938022 [Sphaerosporella brunnea]|uniref:GPI anchored protein n=1 Tax=Sphaerosporella brunnea TaxID=1250544 RepID=A0A5J5F4D2_9PEZI|nr:hypothetical protein FN846DRAFT_938022 [Sphaerosporella brunnea]
MKAPTSLLLLLLPFAAAGDVILQNKRSFVPLVARDVTQFPGDVDTPQKPVAKPLIVPRSNPLEKRQNTCPSGTVRVSCPEKDGCCDPGNVCFVSSDGKEGCCPIGQTCTSVNGCDTGFMECPANLGGGCCALDTTCSASNGGTCVRGGGGGGGGGGGDGNTTNTTPCSAGRFRCATDLGGGCCPTGTTCSTSNGGTCLSACDTGRYRCASNLGGGCCPTGTTCTADGKCLNGSSSSAAGGAGTTTTRSSADFTFLGGPATDTSTNAIGGTTATATATSTRTTNPALVATAAGTNAAPREAWNLGGAVVAGVVGLAAVL